MLPRRTHFGKLSEFSKSFGQLVVRIPWYSLVLSPGGPHELEATQVELLSLLTLCVY